jgi:4-amino-4-deoxy-L-arabinose transferase-like glycosyltransferase
MAWWSLAVVVLFSIPRSKLAHYLAPAFPAMAILVGAWFDAWLRRERATPAWGSLAFGVIGAGGAVCAIAAAAAAGMPPPVRQALAQKYGAWTPGWSAATILAALAVGLCAAVLAARWRRVLVAPLLSATMLVVGTIYVGWFGPRRAEIQAHPRKELARWLAAAPGAVPVGVYYAKRNATVFYLGRPIRDLGERRAEFPGVVRFLSSPAPAVVLTHRKFVAELRQAIPGLHLWSQRGDYVVVGNVPPP